MRFQLVFVSIILFLTFVMMMSLVMRYNRRWDVTREKIYSLSQATVDLLKQMNAGPIEIIAFYPHDDPSRSDFETFLKECQMRHERLQFRFYDPDRSPQLTKQWRVKKLYTVIIRYQNKEERVFRPNEEMFANALLRLVSPKVISLCFVTGHGEAGLWTEEQNGLKLFREALEENNFNLHEILLARDKVPAFCQMVVAAGPQRDWESGELDLLTKAFEEGRSILFLMDPVDPGTGKSFDEFMKRFGIRLGADVIVDKMSRMVGGDFLVPFVNQYVTEHPITAEFDMATFFPVARSIQSDSEVKEGIKLVPLAFAGSGSWAETNLEILEKGEAAFDAAADLPGPIPLAVAVEAQVKSAQSSQGKTEANEPTGGRMVVVGDSDFITNAYLELAGNKDLVFKMIQWLSKDTRAVVIHRLVAEFQPLFLSAQQRFILLAVSVAGYPILFLVLGTLWVLWRRKPV